MVSLNAAKAQKHMLVRKGIVSQEGGSASGSNGWGSFSLLELVVKLDGATRS